MKHLSFFLACLLTGCLFETTWAFPERMPTPLVRAVKQSQLIVVATLLRCTPDSESEKEIMKGKNDAFGEEGLVAGSLIKPAADYEFGVLTKFKGECDETLSLTLPPLVGWYYKAQFEVREGDQVLLLLRRSNSGAWEPTSFVVPLVPVKRGAYVRRDEAHLSPLSSVISVLLASLDSLPMRRVNTYLLRDVIAPELPNALVRYLSDADAQVRSNVLSCLAVNQQVSVIPRIAELQAQMALRGDGTDTISALQKFKTPAAIPYLNPLLLSWEEYTRINTTIALQDLADRSSIPYLMLALFDPETQNVVGYSAYRALHRLIPALGRPRDPGYFEVQREAETARLLRWWKDELSGKHPQLTLETLPPIADFSTLPLEKLNVLLFQPSPQVRQQAMAQLQTRADKDSIPYLILALYDPDESVAYGAYTKLYQLIPKLKVAKDRAFFAAHRADAIVPAFDWWQDELLGRHIQTKLSQLPPQPQQQKQEQAPKPDQQAPKPDQQAPKPDQQAPKPDQQSPQPRLVQHLQPHEQNTGEIQKSWAPTPLPLLAEVLGAAGLLSLGLRRKSR